MNKTIIILILIFTYACKTEHKEQTKLNEIKSVELKKSEKVERTEQIKIQSKKTDENKIVLKDTVKIKTEFNIDYIKSKTTDLSNEISISDNQSLQNKKIIPKAFLKKYISKHKINVGFPDFLPAEYPNSYAFKEFKEFQQFDLFTFTYADESCCTTLYAVTTKKDTIDIINIGVIGYTGGDGGWIGDQSGKWINEYLITNIESSEYVEPASDEPIEKEIDTVWSQIKIQKSGIMKYTEIKKVKYLGTKKIK